MYELSGYSMLAATSTTLMLSVIFLVLSHQEKKSYMRLWGASWLLCSLMFALDFININYDIDTVAYIMFRQMLTLIEAYLFMIGTCRFFHLSPLAVFNILTLLSSITLALYPLSPYVMNIFVVPNILICSGMLITCACMFVTVSWTQNMPEKLLASGLILLWSIFINHFGFTINNEGLAIVTYFVGLITVNILMLVLIIIYFKRLQFVDSLTSSRFRLLVENSSDTMFLYNYKKNGFEYVSSSIVELVGVTDYELYNDPTLFYKGLQVQSGKSKLLRIFSSKITNPGSGVLRYYHDNGLTKWVEIHYVPIKDTSGTISTIEGILRDITEKKQTEENLRQAELEKEEFIENISHEIKTPITLIQGYSESIINNIIPPAMTDTYLRLINSKADLLKMLLDDLRQASSLSSQELEYKFYEQPAKAMVESLLLHAEFQISSSKRKATVTRSIPDNITVIADSHRIQQVISNILNNAIRYTDENRTIKVDCTFYPNGIDPSDNDMPVGELQFTVHDSGPGISELFLPHIFERGFSSRNRLGNNTQHTSGLGLYISRQIIQAHSGRIFAANDDDGGAKFIFTLPCYQLMPLTE